jgi:hypothetical protein
MILRIFDFLEKNIRTPPQGIIKKLKYVRNAFCSLFQRANGLKLIIKAIIKNITWEKD